MKNPMNQIIEIDENARIVIEPLNYILQYRRDSKNKISWRVAGYFPTLTSLCLDYLETAPQRSDNAIMGMNGIVVAIQKAEARICELIINPKSYEKEKKQEKKTLPDYEL